MKILLTIVALVTLTLALCAQPNAPKVELTWDDTINPPAATYNVKRAPGLCTGTPTFATIATGLTNKTHMDENVSAGHYCYVVTAVVNGIESEASNSSQITIPPAPPTNLQSQKK